MSRSWERRHRFLMVLGLSISPFWMDVSCPSALGDTMRQGIAAGSPWEANSANLLVDYFHKLLDDRNFEAFRDRVAAQYTEEMLCRILLNSPAVTARRAAVLSLGFAGRFERSNTSLGRALRDSDVTVRKLAEDCALVRLVPS